MFSVRRISRVQACSLHNANLWLQGRCSASQLSKDALKITTPLAEKLSNTGLWALAKSAKGAKKRPKGAPKGDKNRVNIVSESLCDDILTFVKPSLERHVGCDLVDIYPGAGLWSSKLHDALQPRSHILLEPDEELYRPFLEPLLAKKGTTLIPKSGIVWRDLSGILNPTHLPHQHERLANDPNPPERNDTLLVTANLAFHPKRRFAMFESLTQLVLYQFISSIRTSSLFNKYGLVRILVWVESSDKHALLAQSCQRRRRLAIDGELSTENITEIAGPDDGTQWYVRDHGIDMASCRLALDRMESAGTHVPKHRESPLLKEVLQSKEKKSFSSTGPAKFPRPWRDELEHLEAEFNQGNIILKSDEYNRLLRLRYRRNRDAKAANLIHSFIDGKNKLVAAHTSGSVSAEDLEEQEAQWNNGVDNLSAMTKNEYILQRDNLQVFNQNPPVLSWDRREVDPLLIENTEFFPNAPCALLDIQPKAMHPLLCAMGPGSSRSGDMFELILRGMMATAAEPISKSIDSIWPGAAEGVLPHCPSLRDPSKGGSPVGGYGELSARSLNQEQWIDILQAWMNWPFRPSLPQLVARIADDNEPESDDELRGAD